MRRSALLLLGITVSATLLLFALRDVDLELIGAALADANLFWAAPFIATLFAFYWLKSARWRDLLSPTLDTSTKDLFPIVMIGYAGTAVLPMQMGEFIRAYIVAKKYRLSYSLPLSSIVMERIFDLLTILTLLAAVLSVSEAIPETLVRAGYVISAFTAASLVVVACLVWATEPTVRVTQGLLRTLPPALQDRIVRQLRAAADGLSSIRSPRLAARIALNSVIQWLLMGGCIWVSLTALGVAIPISGVILVLIATIVGISLPTSPGYVGNIQFAFVVALQPFGVSPADAFAASVFYHVLAYASVVVVGFSFLHRMGFSLGELGSEARASAEP